MNKRNFFKYITSTGLLVSQSIWAQPNKTNPKLLFIYLRGAADGLNMLIPYNDSLYYQYRPTLSLEKSLCLPINGDFGLHPNFQHSLYDLYKNNQTIFFPASGQLDNSRSHFQAQDILGYGINKSHYKSGFLNRLGEIINGNCVSFTETIRPILSGNMNVPTLSLKNITINNTNEIEYLKSQFKQDFQIRRQFDDIIKYNEITSYLSPNNTINSTIRFQNIAQFLDKSDTNVGYIELDSWDTHANQGLLHGQFGRLTKNLNDGLVAFKNNTNIKNWNNTLIVIMSEFGRTVKENGSKGTDHGHGNLMILCGGLIKKSAILGTWSGLGNLHENRDLPVHNDYRNILRKTFAQMYNLNNNQLDYIFPQSINENATIL